MANTRKPSKRSGSKKGSGTGSVLDRFTAKELAGFSPDQLAVMSGQTPAVATGTPGTGETAPMAPDTAPSGFANKVNKALKVKGSFSPEGSTYTDRKGVEHTINATAGTLRIKGDGNGKLVFMSAKRFVEIQNDPDLIKAGELLIKAYPELVS